MASCVECRFLLHELLAKTVSCKLGVFAPITYDPDESREFVQQGKAYYCLGSCVERDVQRPDISCVFGSVETLAMMVAEVQDIWVRMHLSEVRGSKHPQHKIAQLMRVVPEAPSHAELFDSDSDDVPSDAAVTAFLDRIKDPVVRKLFAGDTLTPSEYSTYEPLIERFMKHVPEEKPDRMIYAGRDERELFVPLPQMGCKFGKKFRGTPFYEFGRDGQGIEEFVVKEEPVEEWDGVKRCFTVQLHRASKLYLPAPVLDITVKSGFKLLAPTWDLLMAYKDKHIDELEYELHYLELLRGRMRNPEFKKQITSLFEAPTIVLGCYCAPYAFCHRRILAEKVLPAYGYVFGGEIV